LRREPRSLAHALVAVLAALALSSAAGVTVAPLAAQAVPSVDPSVRSSVQSGRVRVLVELRVPADGDAARREDAIARAQDAVLVRLPRPHAVVSRRYATVPMLALEIDSAALAALEAMPDAVVSVRADGLSRPQ